MARVRGRKSERCAEVNRRALGEIPRRWPAIPRRLPAATGDVRDSPGGRSDGNGMGKRPTLRGNAVRKRVRVFRRPAPPEGKNRRRTVCAHEGSDAGDGAAEKAGAGAERFFEPSSDRRVVGPVIALNAHHLPIRLPDDSSRDEVPRLIRRICVLRERGDAAAADRLEQDRLGPAIAAMRAAHGDATASQAEIDRIFATESARAAEAVIVADLLLQQLSERWPLPAGAPPRAAPATDETQAPEAAMPRSGTLEIADFLDAMLAGDRAARRPASR